jgi:surface antigen
MSRSRIRATLVMAPAMLAMLIAGCAQGPGATGKNGCPIFGPKATVGLVGGAAGGAALGAALSKNQGVGALVGLLVGAAAGTMVGGALDQHDCEAAQAAMRAQMDSAPVGQQITWHSTTGDSGSFTPISPPTENGGRVCRAYKRDLTLKNGEQTGGDTGIVCRDPGTGDWVVASN